DGIGRHMVALTTYLGHSDVRNGYWYLEATPALFATIAARCENIANGGNSSRRLHLWSLPFSESISPLKKVSARTPLPVTARRRRACRPRLFGVSGTRLWQHAKDQESTPDCHPFIHEVRGV